VFSYDEEGREFRVPEHWTDVISPEPFVLISAGRSLFRVGELVKLSQLVRDLHEVRRVSSKRKRKKNV